MIHGLDRISVESWDFVKSSVETAKKKGVRFAYLFDTIMKVKTDEKELGQAVYTESDSLGKRKLPMLDLMTSKGLLYNNLTSDLDYIITGLMTNDELQQYEKLVSAKGKLPAYLMEAMRLTGALDNRRYQIYSPADKTNVTISADFGI